MTKVERLAHESYTVGDITLTGHEWLSRHKLTLEGAKYRLNKGMSAHDAFTMPKVKKGAHSWDRTNTLLFTSKER